MGASLKQYGGARYDSVGTLVPVNWQICSFVLSRLLPKKEERGGRGGGMMMMGGGGGSQSQAVWRCCDEERRFLGFSGILLGPLIGSEVLISMLLQGPVGWELQLAKDLGAAVFVTSSGKDKLDFCKVLTFRLQPPLAPSSCLG